MSQRAPIDRTVKLYIGGKQARPDSGYSVEVRGADGRLLGESPLGNRKDIRNAVEAARKAEGWAKTTAHQSGAGALLHRGESFAARRGGCRARGGRVGQKQAEAEVRCGIERIFSYAAWADKYDGAVHNPPFRSVALGDARAARHGRNCVSAGGASAGVFVSGDARAGGGQYGCRRFRRRDIRLITGDLYQVFETSDLPGGAVNIVTGDPRS